MSSLRALQLIVSMLMGWRVVDTTIAMGGQSTRRPEAIEEIYQHHHRSIHQAMAVRLGRTMSASPIVANPMFNLQSVAQLRIVCRHHLRVLLAAVLRFRRVVFSKSDRCAEAHALCVAQKQ